MQGMVQCVRLELARLTAAIDERRLGRPEGQTLVEYAMILALIALVVIGVVTLLGGQISSVFSNVASDI